MKIAYWTLIALIALPFCAQAEDSRALALTLTARGSAHQDSGRVWEAERCYLQGIKADPALVEPVDQLASLYFETRQYSKAEKWTRQALAMIERDTPGRTLAIAKLTGNLGSVYEAERRYDDAERLYVKAVELFESAGGATTSDAGFVWHNLASLRMAAGKPAEAEILIRRALTVWETALGTSNAIYAQGLAHLAHIEEVLGRGDDADALWMRSLGIAGESLGPSHPTYTRLLRAYAESLDKRQRKAEARRARQQARSISTAESSYTVDYWDLR